MSFDVAPDAYARFMGRFSRPLATRFVRLVEPRAGQRALDVGCGTGVLTDEIVALLGPESVAAVDPSESFVRTVAERHPTADVRLGTAEALPFDTGAFDLVLAQLVVHFMTDPRAGLREMARVAAPAATVGASVWDHGGGRGPLAGFWRAARELDPAAPDESDLAGVREGDLALLFMAAGMGGAVAGSLEVVVEHSGFADWWDPFTLGVGPAGSYVASLAPEHRRALRDRCRAALPDGPFSTSALAWTAVWTRPGP